MKTTNTIMQTPKCLLKSAISFLATNAQKINTGVTIRNTVRNNDLTSGPNIILPCRKNICIHFKMVTLISFQ